VACDGLAVADCGMVMVWQWFEGGSMMVRCMFFGGGPVIRCWLGAGPTVVRKFEMEKLKLRKLFMKFKNGNHFFFFEFREAFFLIKNILDFSIIFGRIKQRKIPKHFPNSILGAKR